MFGTPEKPGLIPQCLQRIFVNVGQNIDDKVFFKPDGLENLIPTSDSTLDIEISARNYIFKDDKNDTVHRLRFSLSLFHNHNYLLFQRRMRLPKITQQQSSVQDLSVEGNKTNRFEIK